MATSLEDFSGEKMSERTIREYKQIAEDLPKEVKKPLKTLTRQSFGVRHAIQFLRLKDKPKKQLELAEKLKPDTIQRYIQIAKELPKKVKNKIGFKSYFGILHAREFLRLKDKPE